MKPTEKPLVDTSGRESGSYVAVHGPAMQQHIELQGWMPIRKEAGLARRFTNAVFDA
jgi:hypothetical protein